jgi:hypothetical protein
MSGKDGLVEREIKTESQRTFTLKCVSFENGLFIVVAEGANRIGSLTVSISSSNIIGGKLNGEDKKTALKGFL